MAEKYEIEQVVMEDCIKTGAYEVNGGFEFYCEHPDNDYINGIGHDEETALDHAMERIWRANDYEWICGEWIKDDMTVSERRDAGLL